MPLGSVKAAVSVALVVAPPETLGVIVYASDPPCTALPLWVIVTPSEVPAEQLTLIWTLLSFPKGTGLVLLPVMS
ncbi:hypothetical protein ABIC65_002030 [Sphingomonas trueperi]|uniref:hypothetical protein n=1 Tax=Sphingomonas trueperi TaxID=53317 RepID=UPI0033932F81